LSVPTMHDISFRIYVKPFEPSRTAPGTESCADGNWPISGGKLRAVIK
jgi:hypothetical protein